MYYEVVLVCVNILVVALRCEEEKFHRPTSNLQQLLISCPYSVKGLNVFNKIFTTEATFQSYSTWDKFLLNRPWGKLPSPDSTPLSLSLSVTN